MLRERERKKGKKVWLKIEIHASFTSNTLRYFTKHSIFIKSSPMWMDILVRFVYVVIFVVAASAAVHNIFSFGQQFAAIPIMCIRLKLSWIHNRCIFASNNTKVKLQLDLLSVEFWMAFFFQEIFFLIKLILNPKQYTSTEGRKN